jgi:hypothetical protein
MHVRAAFPAIAAPTKFSVATTGIISAQIIALTIVEEIHKCIAPEKSVLAFLQRAHRSPNFSRLHCNSLASLRHFSSSIMTAWKASKNRGFYYGEAGGTPWTNDLMWKVSVTPLYAPTSI